jgi:HK97 family phage portal protein
MMRGLFGTLRDGLDRKALDPAEDILRILRGGGDAKSGVSVTVESALGQATAFACGRVIAEGISQVPFKLFRKTQVGSRTVRRQAEDHPLYRILSRQPNDWMDSFQFRETLTFHAVFAHGGFAWVNRVRGEIVELLPLMPSWVSVEQGADWKVVYRVRLPGGQELLLPPADMLHIRGPSWDGVDGMVAVRQLREALGLSIAIEESQSRLYANGARPGGILTVEDRIGDDAKKNLKTAIDQAFGGNQNAFKTAVLDFKAKWQPLAVTGVDGQLIQTRMHQIEEVCRGLRVFPQMIGHGGTQAPTYASAEQFFIAHVVHTMGPWVNRWEMAVDRLLGGDMSLYSKLRIEGLLRGDATARANFYTKLFMVGALSPNDIRELEDQDPYEGGDEYRVPVNMEPPGASAEADAAGVAKAVRSLIGHNGGPPLDDEQLNIEIRKVLVGGRAPRAATPAPALI